MSAATAYDTSPPPAAVIGLGNVDQGDFGVGARVIEALEQEPPCPGLALAFAGEDLTTLPTLLCGVRTAVIVAGVGLTGWPGTVSCIETRAFFDLAGRNPGAPLHLAALADRLAWIDWAMGLPPRLAFVLVEVARGPGPFLPIPVPSGLRRAGAAVQRVLADSGCPLADCGRVSRLYRFSLPDMTA